MSNFRARIGAFRARATKRTLAVLICTSLAVILGGGIAVAQVTGAFDGSGPNNGGDLPFPSQVGNESPQQALAISDIDQVWDAYANYLDSGQASHVADLFTPHGGYVLLYNDRATGKLDPMGYSPTTSGNGTAGTPGGGCTALGHQAIVNFLSNIGLGNNNPRAQLSHHIVTSKLITVNGNFATMHAYWMGVTGPDTGQTATTLTDGGQYDNTFVRTPQGWKVDQNRVIFDSNITNYPCRN